MGRKDMKLRRYKQFINESVEITKDLFLILYERGKFWNAIFELDYSKFDFTYSYSDMCKRINRNPEEDFQKIQKYFDEEGFTLEEIKDLFSEENNQKCGYNLVEFYRGGSYPINKEPLRSIVEGLKNKLKTSVADGGLEKEDYDIILQPFSIGSSLYSKGAIQDIYLYKLFEKLGLNTNIVQLGGGEWGDVDGWENDGDYSEAFIRYRYGYHQTEYGKLWMKQAQIDEEWLREEAMGDLQSYIEDEFPSICSKIFSSTLDSKMSRSYEEQEKINNARSIIYSFKLEEFSIIEEDRIIIDIEKLCSEIFKLYDISKVEYTDIEKASAEFIKRMEIFHLDIELSYTDDLIIWGRFREE